MIPYVKLITTFTDFMLASLIILISTKSKSKNESIGWATLVIVFALNMILIWV